MSSPQPPDTLPADANVPAAPAGLPLATPRPPWRPARPGGLGCVAVGCVVLLIVGLLGAGLLGGFAYWGLNQVRGLTDDHPEPVPIMGATDAQAAEVAARLKAFAGAMDQKARATLTLSADDLNILVARDPRYRTARGRVFFAIRQDTLHTRVSIPLDGIPGFKGRWFNGAAGLDVRFVDGELTLKPVSLEYRGKQVSQAMLRAFSTPEVTQQLNESLREQMRKDPEFEQTARQIESIDIKDNKLVIVSDGGQDQENQDDGEGEETKT